MSPDRGGAARDELLRVHRRPVGDLAVKLVQQHPQERLNKEVRRRIEVVGIVPNRGAVICLVGPVLAEQTDEWTESRRYTGFELPARSRLRLGDPPAEVAEAEQIVAPNGPTA